MSFLYRHFIYIGGSNAQLQQLDKDVRKYSRGAYLFLSSLYRKIVPEDYDQLWLVEITNTNFYNAKGLGISCTCDQFYLDEPLIYISRVYEDLGFLHHVHYSHGPIVQNGCYFRGYVSRKEP